jgi:hypothetical protein
MMMKNFAIGLRIDVAKAELEQEQIAEVSKS